MVAAEVAVPRVEAPDIGGDVPRLSAAVAALAMVTGLAACGPQDRTPTERPSPTATGRTPTPTATSTATPSPTPEPPSEESPTAAAVTADGSVVTIDTESGQTGTVLLTDVDVSDPAAVAVDVHPDGGAVFVTRPRDGATEVVRLAADGSSSEVVAPDGWGLAVSPDGGTLAYVTVEGERRPAIVLHDLATGGRTVLRSEAQEPFVYISELTWTPDGGELVFMAGEIATGLHVVPVDAGSLDQARRLGPADRATSWRDSAALDDGRLAVVAIEGEPPMPDAWTIRLVDLASGEVVGEPLPDDRVEAASVDARAGEDALLLVVDRQGPEGGTLVLWDGQDETRPLARDVVTAAW